MSNALNNWFKDHWSSEVEVRWHQVYSDKTMYDAAANKLGVADNNRSFEEHAQCIRLLDKTFEAIINEDEKFFLKPENFKIRFISKLEQIEE